MTTKQGLSPRDPSSYSRPELASVTHIAIQLTVDFNKQILSGDVELTVVKIDPKVNEVILDVKDLRISKIVDKATDKDLKYNLAGQIGEFGSKLTIDLAKKPESVIKIFYETSPNATGLQWLTASQTVGRRHPYLFSQFQAIHARSVLPCQDTPSVKTKYTATITAPKDLTVLMSAHRQDPLVEGAQKHSKFVQNVPVPSYLIAIAVGALESREIGPRSRVWAEKELVDDCAFEFAETEHQLKTAEEICGPYLWGIYDLLVLPPSFAFGGMENPCLTFVTPTLLAGDRSLANVVAHEIAHSWTGNLITNKNFEHFWLNEGFTVFVERKIKGRLTTPQEQDFDAYGRLSELREIVDHYGKDSPLTRLVVDLVDVNPDDAFSMIPYEKGQTFLRYLETTVGGPKVFEPFLREYFDTFKYKSVDTDDFKQFFEKFFVQEAAIKSIDWKTWLYAPGMPPVIPKYDTSRAETCDQLVKKVVDWNEKGDFPFSSADVKDLSAEQRIYFLQELLNRSALSVVKLQELERVFGFSRVKNGEIKFRWFRIGIKARWIDIVDPVLSWVNEVGRMKYVRPLYRDLYDWQQVRQKIVENFQANRKYMMHVVAYSLYQDLHLS